ncbi:hypothetical protein KVR01_000648 [Diaporthe batatas]|uniref:uncharacterized protein n=1 Tax=Diaporthe batatas TaxID=748121 RepID=UPI001D056B8E|nr:uncharacterized protein KVR01_000648 [Diaporthe batatas]KAG8169903.1 hypothetical protein KVR01_000648 [Diaporthe batatas]
MAAVRPKEGGKSVGRGKVNRHNALKLETTPPENPDVPNRSGSKLPRPLGPRSRRILAQETSSLIRKRNELDRALLVQTFRPLDQLNATDWLPREELLRQCEQMVSLEKDYIRTTTKELGNRTAFYNHDPSKERALDADFIRNQLGKFKRHLGPYLAAAEEAHGGDEEGASSSGSTSSTSDKEAELAQGRPYDSGPSRPAGGNAADGSADHGDPSVGLDGAFDDIRDSRKRKMNGLDSEKKSRKKARKEQPSDSSQSTAPQSHCAQAGPPTRSKDMESSLAQIYTSMSQTKSSQASINGAIKTEIKEEPVKTTPTDVIANVERKPPNPSATTTTTTTTTTSSSNNSSSNRNSISDGALRPFYQRHAKAMIRPDFDDLVYDRPQRRRAPKSKQKRRAYLVSGALPVPHLPSPRPEKPKARSVSTDGP